jgi:hypothetical protein
MAQTTITPDTNQIDSSTIDVQYLSSSVEGHYRLQQLASAGDSIALGHERDTSSGDRIPAKLLRVLKKDDRYRGWETSGVYLDADTNLYMVSVMQGRIDRTYGFNAYGKPVLVTETIHKHAVLGDPGAGR